MLAKQCVWNSGYICPGQSPALEHSTWSFLNVYKAFHPVNYCRDVTTRHCLRMKGAAVTLLVLLVCLSVWGGWAQGDRGGRVKGSESTSPDIWTELRNMVVEQTVELRNMEAKLRDSEKQVEELKREHR